MWEPRKCHYTIVVEFKSPKKRNLLGKMEEALSTKRGGRDWIPNDPWVQPGFISKTTVEASSILWFDSGSSFKGIYYIMCSPLRVSSISSPSYVWTSISVARKLLLLGIRQKIHSGYGVKVWEDPWISTTLVRLARPLAPVLHPNMRVSDLINQESK